MLFDNNDFIDLGMFYSLSNFEDDNSHFLRGNMFDDIYRPYKNMTYFMPKLKTNKEKDLFNILSSSFAINDYNLYLDLNPNDMNILNKFNTEVSKFEKLKKEYEMKYGFLDLCNIYNNSFTWINNFPWDKDGGKYV